MLTRFVFVRHTSVGVAKGVCYGQTDVPLAGSFAQEAEAVMKQLNEIIAAKGFFDAVYTSPLSRCTLLAGYCGFDDAVREDRLLELNFGQWEMRRWCEFEKETYTRQWFIDWQHLPAPGGESFAVQCARVTDFMQQVVAAGHRHVLVFAHGGVIACAKAIAGKAPLDAVFSDPVPYGGIEQLAYSGGTISERQENF